MSDSKVYVGDSPIHGKGLFAKSFIPEGTVIGVVQGEPARADGPHVLWVDDENGFHVLCDLRFINHSKNPNACYYDDLSVVALEDIAPHQEITHNYANTDY